MHPEKRAPGALATARYHLATLFAISGHRLTLAFCLILACSLTEGLGLLLLVPMLQAVGLDVQHGSLGRLASFATRGFSSVGLKPTLVSVLAIYVGVSACQALLVRWQSITNEALGFRFVEQLRIRLYGAFAHANWLFLARARASSLTHALTNEIDRVSAATYYLVSLGATSTITAVYVLLALRVSPAATLLVFACGGALMWTVSRKNAASRKAGERASDTTRTVYGVAIEHLQSMKTTRSYAAEERSTELFARGATAMADSFVHTVRLQATSKAWFDVGSVVVLALLVLVTLQVQKLSTAAVLLLLFLFARMMPRVSGIQQAVQQYVSLLPAVTAIANLQRECEAARESSRPRAECPLPSHAIRLDGVSFRYPGDADNFGVSALDLEIRVGETTALVGPSGSGKSTVADLLLGLLSPDGGQVLIDSAVLRPEMFTSWREHVGYVPQETWLFHDTLRANLQWAAPGSTDAQMFEALRLAAADEIVAALPRGLNTVLGDRGIRLSGGERQRIALARALLRNPSLLVLDEATSAIDAENERRILDAITRLHGRLTILFITHRLASVRSADKIYVLEQGHLTEAGSWDTLTSAPGSRFRAACLAQGILLLDDRAVPGGA